MYRNQYLVTTNTAERFHSFVPFTFCGLSVFSDCTLPVHQSSNDRHCLLLLGFALDPENHTHSNQTIANELLLSCDESSSLFTHLERIGGRFVILVGDVGPQGSSLKKIIGDACSLRQMHYGHRDGYFYLTSSIKMFLDYINDQVQVRNEKAIFMNHSQFAWNDHGWYCDEEPDDRLKRLLPNHYFDYASNRVFRIPFQSLDDKLRSSDVYDICTSVLKGTYKALLNRYALLQPLTAGMDSRMLLASTREFVKELQFYIFDFERADRRMDIYIAAQIAKENHLNFRILRTQQLTDTFRDEYKKEHVFPRLNAGTRGIQYHYFNHRTGKFINMNGNCGEILRSYLGFCKGKISRHRMYYYTRYSEEFPFLRAAIENWYDEAVNAIRDTYVSILDLFYWELKMGVWGAQYPFEQDIAMEECSPFNNKRLLLTFMSIPATLRRKPALKAPKEWVEHMWPGLSKYAINPWPPSRIKRWVFNKIYSDSRLVYYFFRYRHLLS